MGIQKMKQGELCDRLQVSKMLANRVIKSKSLPEGLKRHQKKGNHYVFNFRQAFWFGIVLKLRQSGVPTGDAEAIANAAKGLFAGLKRGRGWSDPFDPFRGGQHPSAEWTLEVGDLQAVRLATSAASGSQGAPKDLMWHSLDGHDVSEKFKPVVVLRLDLAYLAKLLPKDKTEPLFDLYPHTGEIVQVRP